MFVDNEKMDLETVFLNKDNIESVMNDLESTYQVGNFKTAFAALHQSIRGCQQKIDSEAS